MAMGWLTRWWSDRSLRTKLFAVAVIPMLAVIAAAAVFAFSQQSQRNASDLVTDTLKVQATIDQLLVELVDVETGVRGYLIFGQPEWLEPYDLALRDIPGTLDHLQALEADNPSQAARSEALRPAVNDRLDLAAQLLAAAPITASNRVDALSTMTRGKAAMDDLRAQLAAMAAEEERLLVERQAALNTDRVVGTLAVGGSLVGAILGGALLLSFGVVGRIRRLEENTRQLARGELPTGVPTGGDEIGRLGKTLVAAGALLVERERQLHEVNMELERFFSMSSDMFAVFNLDGTFRRVNAAWETDLGWGPGELFGRPFLELVHPDDRGRTTAEFETATATGLTVSRFENRYRHKDGSYRWLDWTGRLVPGEQVHYATARDVSERKQIGLALEAVRQEAEAANLAKSEFLSRMSHELRTPLNAVLGFAQLLEMDELTAEQLENVAHIARGGRHLLELINEVLDISRIESGTMTISLEPVPVPELLSEVVAMIGPIADGRSITIDPSGAGCDTHMVADRQRLKQVLLNLLANAVKYNSEGGRVTIACAMVDGSRLAIRVTDTGYGIPADRFDRLFQPFERLGAEQSGVEGTGMGLTLSKGLVEAMGGSIGVESELDQGTTFWVELEVAVAPLEAYEATAADQAAAEAPAGARVHRVLHIEDNLSNLKLIERIIARRPGIELLSTSQGQLGIDLARQHRPDLVLLDVHLPDMPGQEVLRRLQGYPETRDTPVVIISADATKGQIARFTEAGASGYLTKPIDVTAFFELIDSIVGGSAGGR